MRHGSVLMYWTMMFGLVVTASCSSTERDVRGTVTVDGRPLEMGTINFRASENAVGGGGGTAVSDGKFELAAKLAPGKYNVTVEGFRKTGHKVADPQRGMVEERVQLRFQRAPVQVEVSAENSDNIQIDLKTAT